ncbi:hypothetical protein [Streptomyces sp. NPDC047886]|uniref:hypothetical protein n=1 Tax=Streptomyces sp. NPDC047886 TaxID=3365490 RepID=UPI0037159AB6
MLAIASLAAGVVTALVSPPPNAVADSATTGSGPLDSVGVLDTVLGEDDTADDEADGNVKD